MLPDTRSWRGLAGSFRTADLSSSPLPDAGVAQGIGSYAVATAQRRERSDRSEHEHHYLKLYRACCGVVPMSFADPPIHREMPQRGTRVVPN